MRTNLKEDRIKILIFPLILILFFTHIQFAQSVEDKPRVICTTTVLSSIVIDLASDQVSVDVISSPAVCPAHYDVRPSDVDAFKHADLILMHGFEPWIEDLKVSSGSTAPIVKIGGGWNNPEMLKGIYVKVAEALEENLGIDVSDRLEKCREGIDTVASWLKEVAVKNGFEGKPVVCMIFQKGFIKSLGFDIVAVYGPPEKVSPKQYDMVIKNASEAHAILVIDNIQSGTEFGKKVASEINGVEVALSNFPGIEPNLNNMTQVMKWNALKIVEALKDAEIMGKVTSLRNQVETWKLFTMVMLVVAVVEAAVIITLFRLRK